MSNDRLGRSKRSWALMLATLLLIIQSHAFAAPKSKQISFWNDSEEQSSLQIDHSDFDSLLQKYVDTSHVSGVNRFNYEAVTLADKALLESYLQYAQQMDPRQLTRQRQKAYWLNLFNATMINVLLDSSADESVRQLGRGVWRKKRLYIAMQKTSLDDIEHGVLRPIYNDPRVHFSMAAGMIGSASILPEAFTGENVEALLEKNTRDFLQHPRGAKVEDGRLVLSSIFKWYQDDFGGNFDSVKQFIQPYVTGPVASNLASARNAKYEYDWALNKP